MLYRFFSTALVFGVCVCVCVCVCVYLFKLKYSVVFSSLNGVYGLSSLKWQVGDYESERTLMNTCLIKRKRTGSLKPLLEYM